MIDHEFQGGRDTPHDCCAVSGCGKSKFDHPRKRNAWERDGSTATTDSATPPPPADQPKFVDLSHGEAVKRHQNPILVTKKPTSVTILGTFESDKGALYPNTPITIHNPDEETLGRIASGELKLATPISAGEAQQPQEGAVSPEQPADQPQAGATPAKPEKGAAVTLNESPLSAPLAPSPAAPPVSEAQPIPQAEIDAFNQAATQILGEAPKEQE